MFLFALLLYFILLCLPFDSPSPHALRLLPQGVCWLCIMFTFPFLVPFYKFMSNKNMLPTHSPRKVSKNILLVFSSVVNTHTNTLTHTNINRLPLKLRLPMILCVCVCVYLNHRCQYALRSIRYGFGSAACLPSRPSSDLLM